ncbi:MAG: phospho-N-acetylmuramoyl-pentapeptide-transferase [Actinobacteria bacterium HGW-Actinobacteria-7]|nr:MAG: phospho-N-acetylmuramoyl-pentapeptide-transferase [Actinobacteria bacterium HGW-Actinobacteria-7]
MVAAAVLFPLWIRLLRVRNIGQQVRADGPQGHLVKQGTPTMGGVLILLVVAFTFLLFGTPTRTSVLALGATLACGGLGFVDDWAKVAHERSLGLRPRSKLLGQAAISVVFCLLAVNWADVPTWVQIPLTTSRIDMGVLTTTLPMGGGAGIAVPWLYLAFVSVMIMGMSNAVNLTDGLDGLAAGTVTIVALAFAGIAFRQNVLPSSLLGASIAGACIGFLWYNSHPADIFMGDTGSLGLGAAIAAMAVITKTELFLLVIGGIYVIETMSVILQVASFKLTGKRIFRMAPIHHHFEMIGWSETKVMVRFWIVTGIMAGLGFAAFFFQSVRFKG